jgi:hypothetical protein
MDRSSDAMLHLSIGWAGNGVCVPNKHGHRHLEGMKRQTNEQTLEASCSLGRGDYRNEDILVKRTHMLGSRSDVNCNLRAS